MMKSVRNILVGGAAIILASSVVLSLAQILILNPEIMGIALKARGAIWSMERADAQQGGQAIQNGVVVGKISKQGQPPTVAGTGSPTVTANSTDFMGQITYGTGGTAATITFSSAWAVAPFCLLQDMDATSTGLVYTVSTTAIVINGNGTATGNKIQWICVGVNN